MNVEERFICEQQQALYQYVQELGMDVLKFSDRFLRSRFCNNSLDKPYSVDQFADIGDWIDFLEAEGCYVGADPFPQQRVTAEEAGWLGYTYRQLHFATGLKGMELAEMVPAKRLVIAFPGLHTVDEEMAVEIIIRDFGLPNREAQ